MRGAAADHYLQAVWLLHQHARTPATISRLGAHLHRAPELLDRLHARRLAPGARLHVRPDSSAEDMVAVNAATGTIPLSRADAARLYVEPVG